MDYDKKTIVELIALTREHVLRGYSGLSKAELITLLQNNLDQDHQDSGLHKGLALIPDLDQLQDMV